MAFQVKGTDVTARENHATYFIHVVRYARTNQGIVLYFSRFKHVYSFPYICRTYTEGIP